MAASPRQAESARAVVWPYMNARRAEGLADLAVFNREVCAVQMASMKAISPCWASPSTVPAKPSQHLRLSARWAAQMSTYPMPFASTSRPTTRFRSHTMSETWGLTLTAWASPATESGSICVGRRTMASRVVGMSAQEVPPHHPCDAKAASEHTAAGPTPSTRSSDVMPAAAKRSYARETLVNRTASRPSSISSSTR